MSQKGKRISKNVTYKAIHFDKPLGQGVNLTSLLFNALTKLTTVGARRRNIGSDETPIFHVIGTPLHEPNGIVFGVLMTYTPGTDPLFLVDDDTAPDVFLEKLSAPDTDDGKRREFLESMLFFVVYKNHVALIQSQALKAAQLENYLNWLLRSSEAIAQNTLLTLIDKPPKAVRDKLEAGGGVRAIKLGGEVVPETAAVSVSAATSKHGEFAAQSTARGDPNSQTASIPVEKGGLLSALQHLLAPAEIAKIPFENLQDANIEMFVTLRYKRNTTEAGQKLMDSLGVALRNTEDVQTELQLKEGGSIKGNELRLTGKVHLRSYDGQLSKAEVFQELQKWLLEKIKTEGV